MSYHNTEGMNHAGHVLVNGDVIKFAAGIGDQQGYRSVEKDPRGIYLLNHGQLFSLRLANLTSFRKVRLFITGDTDSTVIASSLVIHPNQVAPLLRWQTVDQAFIAQRRDSWEGQMAGAEMVSEGGGGLIKVIFTVGVEEVPQTKSPVYRNAQPKGVNLETYGGGSLGVEGVMSAGSATGQQFGSTSFMADESLPEFEIQLRWAIRVPQAPADRRRIVYQAPSL